MCDLPEQKLLYNTELEAAKEKIELLRELVESQKLTINNLEKQLVKNSQKLDIKTEELSQILMSGVCFD